MAWDTQKFAARMLKRFGDGTPFFFNAAGRKILILLDPYQIKRVLNASEELDPNPFIHDMVLGQMLGSPKETVEFYKNDEGKMDHVQTAHIRQHVTGSGLIGMSRKTMERLRVNIGVVYEQGMKDGVGWMQIDDLFDFAQYHVTRAITESLLGCTISDEYPEFYKDQWTFMDRSVEMITGLPRWLFPTAYNARDRLLSNLKRWALTSDALRKASKADKAWDATAGSGLLQERRKMYEEMPSFDDDARASQILGLLFAGNGLTPTVSFWYLFEALKDLELLKRIKHELSTHYDKESGDWDLMGLTTRPILQAAHAETTRCYSSNVAFRVVTVPAFELDDKYTITKVRPSLPYPVRSYLLSSQPRGQHYSSTTNSPAPSHRAGPPHAHPRSRAHSLSSGLKDSSFLQLLHPQTPRLRSSVRVYPPRFPLLPFPLLSFPLLPFPLLPVPTDPHPQTPPP